MMNAEAAVPLPVIESEVAFASTRGVAERPAEPPTVIPTVGAVILPLTPWVMFLLALRSTVPPTMAAFNARLPPEEPRVAVLPPPAVMGKPTVRSFVLVSVRLPLVVLTAPVMFRVPTTFSENVF